MYLPFLPCFPITAVCSVLSIALTVILMCLRERNRQASSEERKEEEELLEEASSGSEMAFNDDS